MSAFPGLEAALDGAAHRRAARRRARPWGRRVAAPILALGAAAFVIALRPAHTEELHAAAPPVTVSEATLALAHGLVVAPPPRSEPVAHADLRAVATGIAARVPHPPGTRESMAWEATPPGPHDMASINDRATVQFLVEYRAACAWATFWLFALGSSDEPALAAATAVLQDIPHWPTQRAALADRFERTRGFSAVAPAAAARDPRPIRAYAGANCAEVPTPYGDVIR